MQQSENKKFIIEGFPRIEENLAAFEKTVRLELHHVNLHFNYQLTLIHIAALSFHPAGES